jgi:hypothetical protein
LGDLQEIGLDRAQLCYGDRVRHHGFQAATVRKPTVRPARSDEAQLSREEALLGKFRMRSSTFSGGYSSCRPSCEALFSGKV